MANRRPTYRNRVNGEIDVYPEELAKHFPNLEEVAPDAKPLAYVPIEQDAIDEYRERTGVADEDAPVFDAAVAEFASDAEEDSKPEDKPVPGKEGKK